MSGHRISKHVDRQIDVRLLFLELPHSDTAVAVIGLPLNKLRQQCSTSVERMLSVDRFITFPVKHLQRTMVTRLGDDRSLAICRKVGQRMSGKNLNLGELFILVSVSQNFLE